MKVKIEYSHKIREHFQVSSNVVLNYPNPARLALRQTLQKAMELDPEDCTVKNFLGRWYVYNNIIHYTVVCCCRMETLKACDCVVMLYWVVTLGIVRMGGTVFSTYCQPYSHKVLLLSWLQVLPGSFSNMAAEEDGQCHPWHTP